MDLFDFDDYKKFVNLRVSLLPNRGRGFYLRLANFLSVSPVSVSQIFKGDRNLTVEQACELFDFFGFSPLESEYFVSLIEKERAGTHKLKKLIHNRLQFLREKANEVKHRIKYEKILSDESKATFYSQWFYCAIRLLTAIPGYQTPNEISNFLGVPLKITNEVLQFLAQHGLCKTENGLFHIGPSSTHIGADHLLSARHHINWRLQNIERLEHLTGSELCLTLPSAISEKHLALIRKELVAAFERVIQLVDDSPAEILTCLNIDLFKIRANSV